MTRISLPVGLTSQPRVYADSDGYCSIFGIWQTSQFQCSGNVNNIRQREEWLVSNGTESNHNFLYFKCSNSTSSVSSSLLVSLSEFDDVLITATRNYLLGAGIQLTQAELKDLSTARLSASGGFVNLSGTGAASGEKLIDIYNKARGVVLPPPTGCYNLIFKGGSVNPSTVMLNGSYTVSCDYGEKVDCISPQAPSGSCQWAGFVGTTANFSCQAGSATGTFSGACQTFTTSKDCCFYSNPISLTVSVATSTRHFNSGQFR